MKIKYSKAFLATVALAFSVAVVGMPEDVNAKVNVKKVTIDAPYSSQAVVARGKKITLSPNVSVSPDRSSYKKVSYKSSKKSVAVVNSKGQITAKRTGTTKVTVKSKKNSKKKKTITVKVVRSSVKKVKLNKTKTSIAVGTSTKLKASVSPSKNVGKQIKWTSSNKKVAKVSSSGKVTAIIPGTTTIKAIAADGSRKNASCKVTVTGLNPNAINIMDFKVINSTTLSFTLNKPAALSKEQISCKRKYNAEGAFNGICDIDAIATNDNMNYLVYLDTSYFVQGDYIQLSIPSLNGLNVKEIKYTYPVANYSSATFTSKGKVGNTFKRTFEPSDFSGDLNGFLAYSVEGLPAGVTAKTKNDCLVIEGVPQAAGAYTAVIKAVDELGSVDTCKYYIAIGSDVQISAVANDSYLVLGSNGTVNMDRSIVVSGGSGTYTYSLAVPNNDLSISGNTLSGTIRTPGVFDIVVNVSDKKNAALTTTCTFHMNVVAGATVTGFCTDGQGIPMSDVYISYEPKDRTSRFASFGGSSSTGSNGYYSFSVAPGVYNIIYAKGSTSVVKNDTSISGSGVLPTVALGVYKVAFINPEKGSYSAWLDGEGVQYGEGSEIYVKPGNYVLHSNVNVTTEYTVSFTVTNTGLVLTPVATPKVIPAIALGVNQCYANEGRNNRSYYSFVCPKTGSYSFESLDSSYDPYANLYDANGESITSNDDGGNGNNFCITESLVEGQTYYLGIYDRRAGSLNVNVTQSAE